MLDTEQLVAERLPQLHRYQWLQKPVTKVLSKLLHEQDIESFGERYPHLQGLEFVEHVLDFFQFRYQHCDHELDNIPTQGRVIIIANHPIGSLDGLALLQLVSRVRSDVKIVANSWLQAVQPLQSLFVAVDVLGSRAQRAQVEAMQQWLADDGALIIFPAGEVSRMTPVGVRDGQWRSGFVKLAQRTQAPVVPVHINAHNSLWFYGASMVYKPLATMMLVQEMFRQQANQLSFTIGEAVAAKDLLGGDMPAMVRAKLMRRHLYRLGKGKSLIFPTQPAVARPEARQALRQAVLACELLGQTGDGKQLRLYQYQGNSPILRELGRLREIAFRAVGEGTGKRRDLDNYDTYYYQLLVWDDNELEIAGAYRFGDAQQIISRYGISGLYTATLFEFRPALHGYLPQALELGRSFVQPRYWGRRSLDYLWQGIGAFVVRHPHYRYLFGAVTLSQALPAPVKDAMVQYYGTHYAPSQPLARARHPYRPQTLAVPDNFEQLRSLASQHQVAVPPLYKHYAELCEAGGVSYSAFNVDAEFADAIDSFMLVDLSRLTAKKRARYLLGKQQLDT